MTCHGAYECVSRFAPHLFHAPSCLLTARLSALHDELRGLMISTPLFPPKRWLVSPRFQDSAFAAKRREELHDYFCALLMSVPITPGADVPAGLSNEERLIRKFLGLPLDCD